MPPLNFPPANRRSFLTSVGALTGSVLIGSEAAAASPQGSGISMDSRWDLSWLDQLHGKHKQIFDLGSRNLGTTQNPLAVVRNYLNAHHDVFGLDYPQVNTLVGITHPAFPINASDAIWLKYKLGERWKIKDFATNQWAVRNVFAVDEPGIKQGSFSIPSLRTRGTIFWQCNNALHFVASELADATATPADQVFAELVGGFMPGVRLVPAHTMLVGLAQERGFTYEKL